MLFIKKILFYKYISFLMFKMHYQSKVQIYNLIIYWSVPQFYLILFYFSFKNTLPVKNLDTKRNTVSTGAM